MRYDRNFAAFGGHPDWYTLQDEKGYIPTDKAPPEAVKAMEKFNSYTFNKSLKTNTKEEI